MSTAPPPQKKLVLALGAVALPALMAVFDGDADGCVLLGWILWFVLLFRREARAIARAGV